MNLGFSKGLFALVVAGLLAGCEKPGEIVIPADSSKWEETLKPAIQSLPESDRALLAGYLMRSKAKQAIQGEEPVIGVTVSGAIESQKAWQVEQEKIKAEEQVRKEEERKLRDEMQAKKQAMEKEMKDAVSVTVVKKSVVSEWGASGRVLMDEHLNVEFGYRNNTEKDIRGVKGLIVVKDMFGDVLSEFLVSNDTSIPAGGSVTWKGSRSVKYGRNETNDRKFSELPEDAYTVDWNPRTIIFADGTSFNVDSKN